MMSKFYYYTAMFNGVIGFLVLFDGKIFQGLFSLLAAIYLLSRSEDEQT